MKHAILALVGAAAVSAAKPAHNHGHQHVHHARRDQPDNVAVEYAPGPTVVVYELNGAFITEDEVQQGLKNGSLVLANDGQLSSAAPSSVAPSTQAPYVAPTSSSSSSDAWIAPASVVSSSSWSSSWSETTSSSAYVAPSSYAEPSSTSSAEAAPSSYSSGNDDDDDDNHPGNGLDEDFPDGKLDCSDFPDQYGAIPVDWMGLGGWTGIQHPGSTLGGYGNIRTALHGDGCTDGAYCSYACPAGYQKSQWPTTQGATGQSVGGIKCQGGKLYLTNPDMSKKLCMTGATEVDIKVENKLSNGKNVAVCRTDYPGTEGETVPLNTKPGKTYPLTCPNADNYYNWQGGKTSAQYYVNPAGVSMSDACQWGSAANPWGNFAPMNLGVGYSNGRAWLSIFQNSPTTDAKLEFSVEIKGGDDMSGTCKYSNGQYCSQNGCSSTTGCTVSVGSGTATFVFSD